MNRIRELANQPGDEESPYGDLYVIETRSGTYRVAPEVARYVERRMDQPRQPLWLVIRDRSGARVRFRTKDIRALRESTDKTRARARLLGRARRREDKGDWSWEDDDY
jgi:hypothetical protein